MKTLFLILFLSTATLAQDVFCCFWTAQGRVTDEYGRSVRAKVTLWGCGEPSCTTWRSWSTSSNAFGYFTFKDIPVQDYGIEVDARRGTYAGLISPSNGFIDAVVK